MYMFSVWCIIYCHCVCAIATPLKLICTIQVLSYSYECDLLFGLSSVYVYFYFTVSRKLFTTSIGVYNLMGLFPCRPVE